MCRIVLLCIELWVCSAGCMLGWVGVSAIVCVCLSGSMD